ncbi:tail fiber assembly protein [Cronobacter sakazakii]|uniref:tail fiber assembly protein n=2 Tax=Cronobacter sakazakii TaxID=28141 RepID=UPI000CF02F3A|nr:tail fiber assembly protein [Cronobacter sakazakii]EGT4448343.1 tail fiber assembly protein [Cronobacter sakazakii]EGT4470589.1 tail fiber assembly protein [Cronobacter sakazakii]EMC4198808.1 tail fiber assembly protein [Cronobacter sakazakii]EMC4308404.1 tail fiber assembly protein [Cronobacter sakazakii]EME1787694.1 tail fiber assembly protein [Cronobacter sakazakii]
MDEFFFSKSKASFYIGSTLKLYKDAGTLPDDLIKVTPEIASEFMANAPQGKIIAVDAQGLPVWVDAPQLTPDEIQAEATAKKAHMRTVADAEIAWRQDAVDAGIATEEESAVLAEWKKYRVLLMRVDTAAPDINWPAPPED